MRHSLPLSVLLVTSLLVSSLIHAVHSESDGGDGSSSQSQFRWEILTNQNFSSDISIHPHILLIVTVPWSGESQSLMKELPFAMDNENHTFQGLKIRLLFRNNEKLIADALGAAEGITIFYYRQTVSYKYQGRLRIENILSSVRHAMSVLPEELPLKNLNTQEDLRVFLDSTDRALLLLEFCGWTQKLLVKGSNNITKDFAEDYARTSIIKETDVTVAQKDQEEQKVMEVEKIQCDADNGIFGIPKPYEYAIMNDSIHVNGDTMDSGDGCSCRFDQFQLFEKFFPNFLSLVRDHFLPPERMRFGVIRDKSLLPLLNVKPSCSWVLTLHLAGCTNCSKVLEDGEDLRTFAHTQSAHLAELKDDSHAVQSALPANKPSVLLFIDRSSLFSQIREESSRVLGICRELASNYQESDQTVKRTIVKSPTVLGETYSPSMMTAKHQRSLLLPANQIINHKDKVSVMIMNDGKHVNIEHLSSELEGSSLHEMLTHILQKQKELKLSSVAKDAGFQLLSEDMHINFADAIPAPSEVVSGKVLGLSSDKASQDNIDSDKEPPSDMSQVVDIPSQDNIDSDKEPPSDMSQVVDIPFEVKSTTTEKDSSAPVGTLNIVDTPLPSVKYDGEDNKIETVGAYDDKVDEKRLPVSDEHKWTSSLSFFFYDGQYRLLKALTSGTMIPSVVIIDPISQQHYVFPRDAKFIYSELSDFVHGFLNGSLAPYQQSDAIVFKTREGPSPPRVNQDFYEVNSIPRVTMRTFSELVPANYSDSEIAGQSPTRNILILFSNSWCGFCQRMELVVREVYRAIKGYANMLKEGTGTNNPSFSGDDATKVISELPLIYLMDCTMNDCSLIMQSAGQRELYPALLLFPAGSKSPVAYEGDVVVADVFKFLTDYGGLVHGLVKEKGLLYTGAEQEIRYHNQRKDTLVKGSNYEVLLKDRLQNLGSEFNQITTHSIISSHETNSQIIAGSMLIATEKLVDAHPFDESKILIVKADQSTGYQGLIFNKHINWDSLDDPEEELKVLTEAPLSLGGPVMRQGMPLVALTRDRNNDDYFEVLPNVYFLHQQATLNLLEEFKAGNKSVHDYWFFLGFSRWEWQQLFSEIAEGAWNVTKGGIELLGWPGGELNPQSTELRDLVEP